MRTFLELTLMTDDEHVNKWVHNRTAKSRSAPALRAGSIHDNLLIMDPPAYLRRGWSTLVDSHSSAALALLQAAVLRRSFS